MVTEVSQWYYSSQRSKLNQRSFQYQLILMAISISKKITLQDFLQQSYIDESPAWEYVEGEVIQKPMGGGKHSTLQKRLVAAIDQAISNYEAFPELRCNLQKRSVVPDIAVLARDRIPLDEDGEIISKGIEFAPAWVIEILSPNQSQTKVTGNLLYCLKCGSQLGWLIDPQARCVLVYYPDRLPELCTRSDRLPLLEGIELNLSADHLFSWLRRVS